MDATLRAPAPALESYGAGPHRQLGEVAYRAISRSIATCALPPGAPIYEQEMAASLGMSRTPLRDALHRLEAEGLVETVPRRGSTVTLLDVDDIQENLEVREALETAAIEIAFARGTSPPVETLRSLLTDMERSAASGNAVAFLEADEQFHLACASGAGNGRVLTALANAWTHINRARYLRLDDPSLTLRVDEHRLIFEAFEAGDARRARAAAAAHVRTASQLVGDLEQRKPHMFRSR